MPAPTSSKRPALPQPGPGDDFMPPRVLVNEDLDLEVARGPLVIQGQVVPILQPKCGELKLPPATTNK